MESAIDMSAIMALPPGPWHIEPHEVRFVHAGLPCLMLRHPTMGVWRGYVAIPETHRFYEQTIYGFDEIAMQIDALDVHGSVTWSGRLEDNNVAGCDRQWWLGFDCCHADDCVPSMLAVPGAPIFGVYRDVVFARAETERLAEQLAAAGDTSK